MPRKKATTTKKASAPTAKSEAPGVQKRTGRPIWQGHLRLSLVSCPIAMYNATTRVADISFHLLNPETNNRIKMIPTDPDTGPVQRSDLVKGYEIAKNKYVIMTDEELDEVKLETTRTLDIERFVDAGDIDRLYWDKPYFLVPDGEMGVEAYTVIREAMADAGRIALGRVTMHTRERLMAIEPRENGMIATTLRMANEVVSYKSLFDDIPSNKPQKQLTDIAEQIIAQQEGPFDSAEFKDRYEEALRELIRKKEKGEKITAEPPPDETNVIDLMEALRKSLKAKGKAVPDAKPATKKKRA
ncbi:MAG TPA: Ku protein [Rhizomicrobium sp.]|jgi:DNA end-binding protein Ku|nr:Ku protein [Rhizomicrobium sp.]